MRSTRIAMCRLAEAGGLLQELLGRWSRNGARQVRGICRQALARADRHLLQDRREAQVLTLYFPPLENFPMSDKHKPWHDAHRQKPREPQAGGKPANRGDKPRGDAKGRDRSLDTYLDEDREHGKPTAR